MFGLVRNRRIPYHVTERQQVVSLAAGDLRTTDIAQRARRLEYAFTIAFQAQRVHHHYVDVVVLDELVPMLVG
jgi:hypothetical protein